MAAPPPRGFWNACHLNPSFCPLRRCSALLAEPHRKSKRAHEHLPLPALPRSEVFNASIGRILGQSEEKVNFFGWRGGRRPPCLVQLPIREAAESRFRRLTIYNFHRCYRGGNKRKLILPSVPTLDGRTTLYQPLGRIDGIRAMPPLSPAPLLRAIISQRATDQLTASCGSTANCIEVFCGWPVSGQYGFGQRIL